MKRGFENVRFPVLAFSSAGWSKVAFDVGDLTDASPDESLEEWQGLEVYDSAGFIHRAVCAFRVWPKSRFGVLLCRLVSHSIHVGFEFGTPEPVQLEALVARARSSGEISGEDVWHSHEELLRALSS